MKKYMYCHNFGSCLTFSGAKEVIKEVPKEVVKTVIVENISPISYATIGIGVVLVVISGVLFSR